MKKLLFLLITVLGIKAGHAQVMRASIGLGDAANYIKVYLRPDVTQTPATFSTLQFNVAIPASVSPVPTLALVSNNVTGVTWIIDPPYVENGYLNYNIYNAQAGYTMNLSANIEFEAMQLRFLGGPSGMFANTAHLVTLPDGGVGGTNQGLFYCTGTLFSNGQDLYYARDANVAVSNGDSYRIASPHRGTFTSYARLLAPIALPVTFSAYDVKCNDKGAMLVWATATEQNSDRFEIQRSENGIDWSVVGSVKASGNSSSSRSYQYLDLKGGAAFYRIRQVDLDGRFVYTDIKRTNCNVGQFDVVLYPVPAKDNLTVVISADKSVKTDLIVVDMAGKTVRRVSTQINKGINTIQLNVSDLSAGQYLLSSSEQTLNLNKKFTVIR